MAGHCRRRRSHAARCAARGPADRPSAHQRRPLAFWWRATAGRDRAGARRLAALHPARRAFAGVDPIAVIEIQRIVRFLKERGIGVLITDHNVRETLGICDHATSSTRARCSPPAARTRSSRTNRCGASTSANISGCSVDGDQARSSAQLGQHLALTPQLQQSIRLLQLSSLELSQEIEQALSDNPLLECDDPPWRGHADCLGRRHPWRLGASACTRRTGAGTG